MLVKIRQQIVPQYLAVSHQTGFLATLTIQTGPQTCFVKFNLV